MLKKIGYQSSIINTPEKLKEAELIILPGVGAFDTGMTHLHELGLKELLDQKVLNERTPILGICLGMQLLTASSEEGEKPGLGYINGTVSKFSSKHD
jgi:glutamine amidotransferase